MSAFAARLVLPKSQRWVQELRNSPFIRFCGAVVSLCPQLERFVYEVCRLHNAFLSNDHRSFNFACGYHLNVDPARAQRFKQLCCHS